MPVWIIAETIRLPGYCDSPSQTPQGIPRRALINTAVPETPSDSQTIDQKSAVNNGIESRSDWWETKRTDILPELADHEQQRVEIIDVRNHLLRW
jgi:hypothetical protein